MGWEDIVKKIEEETEEEVKKILSQTEEELKEKRKELKKEGEKLRQDVLQRILEEARKEREKRKEEARKEEERKILLLKGELMKGVIDKALEKIEKDEKRFSEWIRKSLLAAVEKGRAEIYYPSGWEKYLDDRDLKKELDKKTGEGVSFKKHDKAYLMVKQGRTEVRISLESLLEEKKEEILSFLIPYLFS